MNIFTGIGLVGLGTILGVLLCAWLIYRSHENFRKMYNLPERKVMKLQLVEDWRRAWRWVSVNCMVLAVAIQTAWLVLDADQRASLSPYSVTAITILVLACGVAGRLVKQSANPEQAEK